MYSKFMFVIIIFICIYFLFKYLIVFIFIKENKVQIHKINEILNNTQNTNVSSNDTIRVLFENYIKFTENLREAERLTYHYKLLFKVFGILGILIYLCVLIILKNNINIYIKITELIIILLIGLSIFIFNKLNKHIKNVFQILELINEFFKSKNLKIDIHSKIIETNVSVLTPLTKSSNEELISLIKEYNKKGDKNDNK